MSIPHPISFTSPSGGRICLATHEHGRTLKRILPYLMAFSYWWRGAACEASAEKNGADGEAHPGSTH